jgi:hypothetical protein
LLSSSLRPRAAHPRPLRGCEAATDLSSALTPFIGAAAVRRPKSTICSSGSLLSDSLRGSRDGKSPARISLTAVKMPTIEPDSSILQVCYRGYSTDLPRLGTRTACTSVRSWSRHQSVEKVVFAGPTAPHGGRACWWGLPRETADPWVLECGSLPDDSSLCI